MYRKLVVPMILFSTIPFISFAEWWNPFTWKIFDSNYKLTFVKAEEPLVLVNSKDSKSIKFTEVKLRSATTVEQYIEPERSKNTISSNNNSQVILNKPNEIKSGGIFSKQKKSQIQNITIPNENVTDDYRLNQLNQLISNLSVIKSNCKLKNYESSSRYEVAKTQLTVNPTEAQRNIYIEEGFKRLLLDECIQKMNSNIDEIIVLSNSILRTPNISQSTFQTVSTYLDRYSLEKRNLFRLDLINL
jgi:hypothetical protein